MKKILLPVLLLVAIVLPTSSAHAVGNLNDSCAVFSCNAPLVCEQQSKTCKSIDDALKSSNVSAKAPVGGTCFTPSDCQTGLQCNSNVCIQPSGAQNTARQGKFCLGQDGTQDTCGLGNICKSGTCIPDTSSGWNTSVDTTVSPLSNTGTSNVKGIAGLFKWFLTFLNGYLVPVIFALAFVFFLFGIFRYFIQGGADEEKRQKGQQFVMWSIIGFVIMFSVWGIINLFVQTLQLDNTSRPPIPTFGQTTTTK